MNNTIKDNNNVQNIINESDDIDFTAVLRILMQKKWTFYIITGFFTVIGIIYSLIATPYYESQISLYPAGDLAENSSVFGGSIMGFAESFGLGGMGSPPTYNLQDIIKSRRLKKDIVLKTWSNRLYPNGSNLIKYWEIDKEIWFSPKKWISVLILKNDIIPDPNNEHIDKAINILDDLISVEEEISGLFTVSVLMEEPDLAANIANYIANFTNDFISVEQHRETVKNKLFINDQMRQAKEELEYSEEELTAFRKKHPQALDTPDLQLIRGRLMRNMEANQAVYITLRQQYEMAKIEDARENLVISILDVAEPAVKKEKPKKVLIVIISMMLGIMCSVGFVLLERTYFVIKD